PLQSVLLRDLTYIHESPTVHKNGNINMIKIKLLSQSKILGFFDLTSLDLQKVYKLRADYYNIEEDIWIQHLFNEKVVMTEDQLYEATREKLAKERVRLKKEAEKKKK